MKKILILVIITTQYLFAFKNQSQKDSIVYKTDELIIKQLSEHIFLHTSFLQTQDYGNVPCNGMIVINKNEAVIFDSPSTDKSSEELVKFLKNDLKTTIKALIPTHFHEDCVGGLEIFNQYNIPSYASTKTITFLDKKGRKFSKPIKSFDRKLTLKVGGEKVYAEYFGEGHTSDNVIGNFPKDKAIFGGCLIKEVGATKGYLGDANVNSWSETVMKIKQNYPSTKIVIPGHGENGGTELFDYTITLFKQ